MRKTYKDWQIWLLDNMILLGKIYGKDNVFLNNKDWQSILIRSYSLPNNWQPFSSRLLIVLPKGSQIFYKPPDRFYLNKGLRTITGKVPGHYFELNGFNDLSRKKFARFSFHLRSGWKPAMKCKDGTNLTHVLHGLQKGMKKAAMEVG